MEMNLATSDRNNDNSTRAIHVPPDLDREWKINRALADQRRRALVRCQTDMGEALQTLRSVLARGVEEVRGLSHYTHIGSFRELHAPPDFASWVAGLERERTVDDMKATWRIESLYTALDPLERVVPHIAKALTILNVQAALRAPARMSCWSSLENHTAMMNHVKDQYHATSELLTQHLEPTATALNTHIEELRAECRRWDPEDIKAFEIADELGRKAFIQERWDDATRVSSIESWEQSVHGERMAFLRTLMRLHLTRPALDVSLKLTNCFAAFQQDFNALGQA